MEISFKTRTKWEVVSNIIGGNYVNNQFVEFTHNLSFVKILTQLKIIKTINTQFKIETSKGILYSCDDNDTSPIIILDVHEELPLHVKVNNLPKVIDTPVECKISLKVNDKVTKSIIIKNSKEFVFVRGCPITSNPIQIKSYIDYEYYNIKNEIIGQRLIRQVQNKNFSSVLKKLGNSIDKFTKDELAGVIDTLFN